MLDVCLEDNYASTEGASCAMAEQIPLPLIGLAKGMVLSQSAGQNRGQSMAKGGTNNTWPVGHMAPSRYGL